ncbi:FG-GAP-like repeat-containing protein [Streptomyces sp. NPDC099088]|uniref:FG-GAP-like repeat-containing protein n=1 Tax=Streptomyces sp. NPDC099088 TaxID=3366101 RepID=UPI0037F1E1EC
MVKTDSGWRRVRSYELAYNNFGASAASKLASLTECGANPSECKRPTSFSWTSGVPGYNSAQTQSGAGQSLVPSTRDSQLITADFNGDGRTDLAWPEAGSWKYAYAKANGDGYESVKNGDFNGEGTKATAFPFDYDLDGRADLMPRERQKHTWRPVLSRDGETVKRATTTLTGPFNQDLQGDAGPTGALTGDFNGDGYQDLLEYKKSSGSDTSFAWSYRQRSGTVSSQIDAAEPFDDKAFLAPKSVAGLSTPDNVIVADLDADGRDEAINTNDGGSFVTVSVTNDAQAGDTGIPSALHQDVKFLDVNGDGLSDAVTVPKIGNQKNQLFYALNMGKRRFTTIWAPMNLDLPSDALKPSQVADYDGDGRQDLLVPRLSGGVSTGGAKYVGMDVIQVSGFSAAGKPAFSRKTTSVSFAPRSADSLVKQGPRVVDVDGDGLDDVLLVDRPDPEFSGPVSLKVFPHRTDGLGAGDRQDLLYKVREGQQNPSGGADSVKPSVTFTYAPLSDASVYTPGVCLRQEGISCVAGGAMYVVKQMRRDAGLNQSAGTEIVSNYSYRTGRVDKRTRAFLGFAERRVSTGASVDTHGQVVERSFYSNSSSGKDPRLQERWLVHALPGGRQSLQRTNFTWSQLITTYAGTAFNYVSKTQQRSYEMTAIAGVATTWLPSAFDAQNIEPYAQSTETASDVDVYGNTGTRVTESSTLGTASVPGTASRTQVTTTPDVDAGQWLIGRPKKVVTNDAVKDGSAFKGQTRTAEYTYDGASERIKQAKYSGAQSGAGRVLTTDFEYDAQGNVSSRTDTDVATGTKRKTSYTVDALGFPASVTNPAGHVAKTTYDPVLGKAVQSTDVNGLVTNYTFDTLGRLRSTRLPSGAESQVTYALETVGVDKLARVTVTDGTGAVSETVTDRAGRTLIERFKGRDGATRQRETAYEPQGWTASQSMYHRTTAAPSTVDKVTYTYDDLGRRLGEKEPHNVSRSWSYNKLTVTSTDARGTVRTAQADERGRTIAAVDGVGSTVKSRRTYQYGPFDNLTGTTVDGAANSGSSYVYDDQGALTSSTDAERGTTTASYNGFGEVTGSKDANNRITAVTRDVLGRLTKQTVSKDNKVTSTLTNTYDTLGAQSRKGMLLQSTLTDQSTGGRTTTTGYTYDSLSRLQNQTQTLPKESNPAVTETLSVGYSYDTFSRPTQVQYPKLNGQSTPAVVGYKYQSLNGALSAVTTTAPGGSAVQIWTPKESDEQDRLTKEEAGDGTVTATAFDWNGAVLQKNVNTSTHDTDPGRLLWGQQYAYDTEGNLSSRTDLQAACTDCRTTSETKNTAAASAGVSGDELAAEKFTYDPLGRIATASLAVGQSTGQSDTWSYDTLGNITSSKRRGTYTYNPQKPTQVTAVTGGIFGNRTYGYDPVGNQTSRPDGKVTYNDTNLPATMTSGKTGAQTSFLYSPGGDRLRKTTAKGVTTYFPGVYERHHANGQSEHRFQVTAGGREIATLTYLEEDTVPLAVAGPILYPHDDRLGSTSLVTTLEGPQKAKVVEERSYDAFGKLRDPDLTTGDAGYTSGIQKDTVDNGYTGHEDDRDLDLVNMKGRIYDPELGRFLTADPFTNGTNPTQAYNRYTYVSNNPLKNTDPTGYEECAWCPEEQGGGGGTGGGTTPSQELMEDWQAADDAFFEGGDWGINPVNGDSPAANQIQRNMDRYFDNAEALAKAKAQKQAEAQAKAQAQAHYDVQTSWKEGISSQQDLQSDVDVAANSVECGPDGAYCSGIADEVTIVGPSVVNDWGRTWCGAGRPCTTADQTAAEKWARDVDEAMDALLEQVALNAIDAYIGVGMAIVERAAAEEGAILLWAGAKRVPVANVLSATRAELAAALGYEKRIPPQRAPFNSHGQEVFTNGSNYITPDIDGHNVSNGWKMFNRKGKRMGTYDAELKRVKN